MNWITASVFSRELPHKPGVYALYFDGKLGYIGSSRNLYKRILGYSFNYDKNKGAFICMIGKRRGWFPKTISLKYRVTREGDHLSLEYKLIKRLQPPLNGSGTKNLIRKGYGTPSPKKPPVDMSFRTVYNMFK